MFQTHHEIDGLVQDCSNSSALAMELLQSCTKPSELRYPKHQTAVTLPSPAPGNREQCA